MKKMLSTLLALFLLVGMLTACNQRTAPEMAADPIPAPAEALEPAENPEPEYDYELELEAENSFLDSSAFGLTISLASEELLSTFDYLHEVDYTLLREARTGGAVEPFNGDNLVIWADVPLYDIALVLIESDFIDDELVFIPLDAFGHTPELLPGQAFVINSYVGLGTLPASGIRFVSGSGERHYFWMFADQSAGMSPNPFSEPDFLALFEDGLLQIEVTRDSRVSQYFTVTLDEIGNAEPIDWFIENQHLWHMYLLVEFVPR